MTVSAHQSFFREHGETDWLTTRDGVRLRYGIWPCDSSAQNKDDGKGTVIFLSGRREFMEKHSETIHDLARRGYGVATFDWRGQGLSGGRLVHRQRNHISDFQVYVDDLREFVGRRVVPHNWLPPPYRIFSHSLGGHVALRYIHEHPGRIASAVLCAPMIGIELWDHVSLPIEGVARMSTAVGLGQCYVPFQHDYSPDHEGFTGNPLTTDPVRFDEEAAWIRQNPDLALGGVTIGWLAAALRSIRLIHARNFINSLRLPVLIVISAESWVVSTPAAQLYASLLPNARIVLLAGARHEILREQDRFRDQLWQAFDAFAAPK